jgi:hypothetical protein
MKKALFLHKNLIVLICIALPMFSVSCSKTEVARINYPEAVNIKIKQPILPDEILISLAPASYQHVSWLNISMIRQSGIFSIFESFIIQQLKEQFTYDSARELLYGVDECLMVSGHAGKRKPDEFLMILKNKKSIETLFERLSDDFNNIQQTRENSDIVIKKITERTLIIGNSHIAGLSQGLAQNIGKSILTDKGFKNLKIKNYAGIMRYRKGQSSLRIIPNSIFSNSQISWLTDLEKYDGTMTCDNGLTIKGTALFKNEKAAKRADNFLNGQINRILNNPFAAILQISWLKKRMDIKQKKRDINMRIRLSGRDLASVNKIIEPFIKIMKMLQKSNS